MRSIYVDFMLFNVDGESKSIVASVSVNLGNFIAPRSAAKFYFYLIPLERKSILNDQGLNPIPLALQVSALTTKPGNMQQLVE